MRVSLSAYGSRGDVEPLVGLPVRLRERGAPVDVTRVAVEAVRAQGRRVLDEAGRERRPVSA